LSYCPESSQATTKHTFPNIQGAVEMMKGLDYHHDKFLNIISRLAKVDLNDEAHGLKADLLHEVVAYLNRLGQFHYFTISCFVKTHCPTAESLTPTIEHFLVFRHKHSAHRSIDKPQKETVPVQETQAMSMSSIGYKIFEPRPGQSCNLLAANTEAEQMEHIRNNWKQCYWVCQLITDHSKDCLNFSIEREHPAIMLEAYAVLAMLLN